MVQGQGQGGVRAEDSGGFIRALDAAFSLRLILPDSWPTSCPSGIESPKDPEKCRFPDQRTPLHACLSPGCNSGDWGC